MEALVKVSKSLQSKLTLSPFSSSSSFLSQWKVRRTLAFSIHELAVILGDQLTAADLVPIFNGFLKDLDEVRIGVLKHLYDFLKVSTTVSLDFGEELHQPLGESQVPRIRLCFICICSLLSIAQACCLLLNVYCPFQLLHADKRREYLYQLQEFMVTDNSRNWRFRYELAE